MFVTFLVFFEVFCGKTIILCILKGEMSIILCILKGEMPFKMHKIIYFFPEKNVCPPLVHIPKIFRPIT